MSLRESRTRLRDSNEKQDCCVPDGELSKREEEEEGIGLENVSDIPGYDFHYVTSLLCIMSICSGVIEILFQNTIRNKGMRLIY